MALPSLAQIMLKPYKTSSCNSSINHLRITCSFLCLYFSSLCSTSSLFSSCLPFLSPCFFSRVSNNGPSVSASRAPGGQTS